MNGVPTECDCPLLDVLVGNSTGDKRGRHQSWIQSLPTPPTHPREHSAQRTDVCGLDARMRIACSALPPHCVILDCGSCPTVSFIVFLAIFSGLSIRPSTECVVTQTFYAPQSCSSVLIRVVLAIYHLCLLFRKQYPVQRKDLNLSLCNRFPAEKDDPSVRRTTDCTLYDRTRQQDA